MDDLRRSCGGGDGGAAALPRRLFVYNLSDAYRVRGRNARLGVRLSTRGTKRGSSSSRATPAPSTNFTFAGSPIALSVDFMFDLGQVFYKLALRYRCRVSSPALADVFFVPAFNTEISPHPSTYCAEQPKGAAKHHDALYARLRAQAPGALEARGGVDHIFLSPRLGAHYFESHPLCELNLLDARLGSAARLSVEQIPPKEELASAGGPFGYHSHKTFLSIPYPSWVRLKRESVPALRSGARARGDVRVPWRSPHARGVPIAAVFGMDASSSAMADSTMMQLRRRLKSRCQEAGTAACVFLAPSGVAASRSNTARSRKAEQLEARSSSGRWSFYASAASLYWNATFCLMPSGDSVTRKASLDALLLGCIPVHFFRGQQNQWLFHWGNWVKDVTITLEYRQVIDNRTDPIEALLSIPKDRVAAMQEAIARHGHRVHWALNSDGDAAAEAVQQGISEDAFDVTLRSIFKRAQDRKLANAGRTLQRREGRERSALLDDFLNVTNRAAARGTLVEGICRGATGYIAPAACAANASVPWPASPPKRPPKREISSAAACVRMCLGCPRCRWASHSLLLQLCALHHTCSNATAESRWHYFTFRSVRVR